MSSGFKLEFSFLNFLLFRLSVMLFDLVLGHSFVSARDSSSLSFGTINYWIKENQPPGLVVGNLLDNLPYKQYFISPGYHFVLQKESEEFFSLKPGSSMLTTSKLIDLESLCGSSDCYNGTKEFQVVALVMRDKQFIQELRINIIVEDVNDNDPFFKNASYTKNIKEIIYGPGKSIDLPRAFDKDLSLINNQISYSLQETSTYFHFSVSKDGKPILIIIKELDAETIDTHRLILIAWNQNYPSRPTASLSITIVIDDINDNEPRFSQSIYKVPILENVELNHQILQLKATDKDKTSRLQFIIVPTINVEIAKTFAISDQGMIYLIKHLDYETAPKYEIPVRVTDGEFSSNGRVEVVIIDVNDCAPQFTLNPENLVISENTLSKTLLGNIVVYDQDSAYVDSGIECREGSPNDAMRFDITENNSERTKKINIYLNQEIDRDQINGDRRFSVIICNDMGINNRLTATFTVTLTVLDANDNSPQFTLTDYVVRVKENLKPQYPLIDVSATDKDDGVNSQIKYFISDHTHQQYFKIDENSGKIIGIQSLDREKQDYYQVTVVATDLAINEIRHTSTATVHIHVIDVNDCAPRINESLNTFSVYENQPIGTVIGKLIATDCDIGQNGKFIFTLIPSAFSHYFELLTNGSLLTKVSFDRESLSQVKFSLRITVRDIGEEIHLSSKTAVCIKILDENDNSPKISVIPDFIAAYNYSDNNTTDCSITVSKTESTNSPIFPFTFSDLDDGPNGQVAFSMKIYPISLKSNQLFYLNVTEKAIKLKRSWQQSDGNRFLVTLIAKDKGSPPRETSKVIMVQFADIPPRLIDQNISMGSFSNVKINVLIIIILVTISTVLTTALIGAIICMWQPCGNKRQSANCRNGVMRDNANDNLRIKGYQDSYLVTSSIIDSVENDETEFKTSVSHIQQNDYCKSEHHWTHEIDETGRPINYYTLPPQLLACTTTTSHEEQRSDSGRGASDEDNPHYNSNSDVFQYKSLYSMIPSVAYTSMTDAINSLTTTIPLSLSKKTILSQIPMECLASSINNEYPLKSCGDNFSYVCTSALPFYSISCGQNVPLLQPAMSSVPESDLNIPLLNLDSYNICNNQPGFNSFSPVNVATDNVNLSYGSGTYPSKNSSRIDNFDDDMVNLSSHIDQLFFSKLPNRPQPFGKG